MILSMDFYLSVATVKKTTDDKKSPLLQKLWKSIGLVYRYTIIYHWVNPLDIAKKSYKQQLKSARWTKICKAHHYNSRRTDLLPLSLCISNGSKKYILFLFLAERWIWLHAICGTCFFFTDSNTKATFSFQTMIHSSLLVERSDPIHSLSHLTCFSDAFDLFSWMIWTFFDSCVDFHTNYHIDALNWPSMDQKERQWEERGQPEKSFV